MVSSQLKGKFISCGFVFPMKFEMINYSTRSGFINVSVGRLTDLLKISGMPR